MLPVPVPIPILAYGRSEMRSLPRSRLLPRPPGNFWALVKKVSLSDLNNDLQSIIRFPDYGNLNKTWIQVVLQGSGFRVVVRLRFRISQGLGSKPSIARILVQMFRSLSRYCFEGVLGAPSAQRRTPIYRTTSPMPATKPMASKSYSCVLEVHHA